jgi:hypothetical protein
MENSGIYCCVVYLKSTIILEEHVTSILRELAGSACYMLQADFLFGLFFDSEDGGDMFF